MAQYMLRVLLITLSVVCHEGKPRGKLHGAGLLYDMLSGNALRCRYSLHCTVVL